MNRPAKVSARIALLASGLLLVAGILPVSGEGASPETDLHWAYRPLRGGTPPGDPTGDGAWSRNPVDRFIREVHRHPEILECFATSGEADFHLRVVVEDIDAYNAFLDDFIFRLPGVSQVRSNIVLKEIKADTALPFR